MSLRDRFIAAAAPRKPLRVQVEGAGCEVFVRVLTVGEREAWELACINAPNGKLPSDFRSRYLALSLCDQDGKRMFSDASEVAALDGGIVGNLFEVAFKHNKMSEADLKELAGE